MKKILLVEDFQTKADSIIKFIKKDFNDIEIVRKESYKSALSEICNEKKLYDLILLDMSMSTFDVSAEESGGEPEPLAGQLILENMYLRDIVIKVLVVTMYERFDGIKLNNLHRELEEKYPDIYIGNVFFSIKHNEWKNKLSYKIRSIYNETGK